MAYKGNTVIISIPLSVQDNQKLHELCEKLKCKSKTRLASTYLRERIHKDYEQIFGQVREE